MAVRISGNNGTNGKVAKNGTLMLNVPKPPKAKNGTLMLNVPKPPNLNPPPIPNPKP